MELPKRYEPKEAEPKWQKYWEENNIYRFDPEDTQRKIYSIDTPPPTVSGKMHMGHAFGNSQQDFIARYKRMKGHNVLQPFGTDDNGLPTQTLIQKLKNVRAQDLPRTEFVKLCLETLEKELRPVYLNDWKKLGISCDFNVSYTTINEHCQKISQKSFLELYEMSRAYRKEAPATWCPKCQTAIAQVEMEDKEIESSFNDIIFKIGDKDLIIATTRPELLPACVAIFFHPEDQRYKELEGKMAKVPLFDFEVPILPDERANPEKGTGIVMCCTFGDQTDIEWQKAHNLPIKTAINKNGKMSSLAGKYENMKVNEARKEIIEDLKNNKLLVNQKSITHAVNTHERCGTEIEFVHSKQWFIKYLDLKEEMIKWGEELNWYPSHMKNRYDNWVNGLQWDWCISRQIYFGIPFPVWYCQDCDEVILAKLNDLPVDPKEDRAPVDKCPNCESTKIVGETDIINTWATSSLTPTIVKELFKDKPVYDYLNNNPMNLRPQGHDIISFWLFNTVVKSHLHFQMKPWHNCFINGWMLDPKGKKMSKSKGNIIEPQGMIQKYSADALRFMSGSCTIGEDLPFPEKDLVTGQKFVNKLWNSSRFSLMHLEDYKKSEIKETFDRWILSKLQKLIESSTENFENYRFFKPKAETEKFFWQIFCDQYLEIVKDRLYNSDVRGEEARDSAQETLYKTLLTILKLMAPFTPHITEEIYQLYFAEKENKNSIHISEWPEYDQSLIDEKAEIAGDLGVDIINAVRKYKSDKQVSLKEELSELILVSEETDFQEIINSIREDLKAVLKVKEIKFIGETSSESEKFSVKIGFKQ
ncbi:MAG: valine--tRNA ligase [Nanoarchaeota archaeon]|nr:valine--tRNA ligase [Nanoarchaeota archaeon]MBU1632275.1 valine--tRNA ligase [Nanoarchaeota archaeon]MBU1876152.1 valine--tRNA ligase [Nanoarchaeota archaeon]